METTPVEWLVANIDWQLLRITKTHKAHYNMIVEQAKEMEKDREVRIKELETFLQEDILDDVYYYHSPIWYRATELLYQNKDKDE